MSKELIIENTTPKTIFMAALLSCTSKFKDASVRTLNKDENVTAVNVTRENVEKLCPTWVSSLIISRLIQYKVCSPIIDNQKLSVDEKVAAVRNTLSDYAKDNGIEMPF